MYPGAGSVLTMWCTGTNYAPQTCASLRSVYHMFVPLHWSRDHGVMQSKIMNYLIAVLMFVNVNVFACDGSSKPSVTLELSGKKGEQDRCDWYLVTVPSIFDGSNLSSVTLTSKGGLYIPMSLGSLPGKDRSVGEICIQESDLLNYGLIIQYQKHSEGRALMPLCVDSFDYENIADLIER